MRQNLRLRWGQKEEGEVCEGALLLDKSGNEPRKCLGRRLEVPQDVVPFLVARSVGDTTSLRETIFLGERAERSLRF